MKFKPATHTEDLYERLVINDSIEMGIHPVIFGYRVRVGSVGSLCYDLDLCGGDNLEMIDLLYNGTRQIIEGQLREQGKINYSEFPIQHTKPFFKDMEFLKDFCALVLKYREHEFNVAEYEITRDNLYFARQKLSEYIRKNY